VGWVVGRDGNNKSPVTDKYPWNWFQGLAGRWKKLIEEGVPDDPRQFLAVLQLGGCPEMGGPIFLETLFGMD